MSFHSSILLRRGQRLLFAGDFARAEETFARAALADPSDFAPPLYRAIALGWLGRKDEAADVAAHAGAAAPRPAPTRFFAALLAADAGRHDAAREHLDAARRDDPRNPFAAGIDAFLALREGDSEPVKRLLAGDLPPSDEFMLRVLLFLEAPKRPPVPAPAVSPPAPRPKPDWRASSESKRLVDEGVSLVEDERYADAVETLRKAVALTPDDATAHACLGEALFYSGDREGAEIELLLRNELARHDQMRADEQSMLVEGYLGRIDYFAGRAGPAFDRLSRAVEAGSPAADDRWFLGLCHWWRGESREAYRAWVRIRRDDPDHLRRRLRELLGMKRGKPPGAFAWIRELRAPQGVSS